jgi:hypothetical protein
MLQYLLVRMSVIVIFKHFLPQTHAYCLASYLTDIVLIIPGIAPS